MKRAAVAGLCVVALVLLSSCARRIETVSTDELADEQAALEGMQAAAGAPLTLAVIPKGTTHEFWKSVHAGAVKAAQELGVEIIWKGPLNEDDRDEQIKVVEDMIGRGVNGIVLAPLDDTTLRLPVEEANRVGIPVVIIDSDLENASYVSFVATDNFHGGQIAGQYLADLLEGKGKLVMLRHAEGSVSTDNREEGFLDIMALYDDLDVVSSDQHGGATTESAYQASENLLAP